MVTLPPIKKAPQEHLSIKEEFRKKHNEYMKLRRQIDATESCNPKEAEELKRLAKEVAALRPQLK